MLKIKQKAKKFPDIQHGVFGAFGVQQALILSFLLHKRCKSPEIDRFRGFSFVFDLIKRAGCERTRAILSLAHLIVQAVSTQKYLPLRFA
ncbi:MAG: hypothetical protein ACI3WQ_07645 [Faecousia sp.]